MSENRMDERPGSPWMKPDEAAQYIGVALGTIRNWASAKYIPHVKRGRVVRFHRDHIDKWLSKGACPGRMTLPDLAAAKPERPCP